MSAVRDHHVTPAMPGSTKRITGESTATAGPHDTSAGETISLLELRSVSKSFPGVRALQNVSLALNRGEILAIVGENGAGKSTLLKILGGILQPDEGEIWIGGERRHLRSVRDAMSVGIGLIHQELNLAPALSVAENLFLGRQPWRGPQWLGITNRRKLRNQARVELNRIGLATSPTELLSRLNIARRQLVEIAKALATKAWILVFDEPTSSLSLVESDRLLAIIEELRRCGTSIIYVSHRLDEVSRIADRVVVLRDGKHVDTLRKCEITHDRMISLMVGRELQPITKPDDRIREGVAALEVRGLRLAASDSSISFRIQPGEILGIAGIVGAGRTELARAIFGIDSYQDGEVLVHGQAVPPGNPRQAIRAGLALVPEDRKSLGVIAEMSIRSNIGLAVLRRLGRYGWYNRTAEAKLARRLKRSLNIRASAVAVNVSTLSGGNQQKVVLAKWLATEPRAFILDEPTRGVDVGAKQEIYQIIGELAAKGMAVMLISSDMEEVIGISDRVLVIRDGRIAGELSGRDVSEQNIMKLAV